MAVKLTTFASEVLNDIILGTLQEHGLERAEELETAFFDHFSLLSKKHSQQKDFIVTHLGVQSYSLVMQTTNTDVLIVAIVHSSRLPASLNS